MAWALAPDWKAVQQDHQGTFPLDHCIELNPVGGETVVRTWQPLRYRSPSLSLVDGTGQSHDGRTSERYKV